ncbi:hypothetical protein D3C80_987740 [compost metagenome]
MVHQLRPQQPDAHAVGPAVQRPLPVECLEQAGTAELTNLRAHHQVEHRLLGELRAQRLRHFAQGGIATGKSQCLVFSQRSTQAIDATQCFTYHGGTTAQHLLTQEPTRCRQIRPHTHFGLLQGQALPLGQGKAAPWRQRLIIDTRIQVGTGQGQHAILFGHHAKTTQRHLDHRRPQRVAQQPVGPVHRHPVQRPALGHAKVAHAEAPGIL